MCRSIKKLRRPESAPTEDEMMAAALQFIRKVSGYHKPSDKNRAAFDEAVAGVAGVTDRLFKALASAREDSHRTEVKSSQTRTERI